MSRDVYSEHAGKTTIKGVKTDKFGNPEGSEFDLAKDGAFKGFIIAVLHFYTGSGFDFSLPQEALRQKGFDIIRWTNNVPPLKEFKEGLEKACQLWVISDTRVLLTEPYLLEIKRFFDAGYGVYIWGDNRPYYADANVVAKILLGTEGMEGDLPGEKVISKQKRKGQAGFIPHLITTGLNNLYEGHTIATIIKGKDLKPLIYGSANNLVTAIYDHDGKRAIIDGGFTRLYWQWDTAGTGRYVKNSAAWLTNYEQWGRGKHLSLNRDLAGRVNVGEESPFLHFYPQNTCDITIGGFLESKANLEINAFDPIGEKITERKENITEHYFTLKKTVPGIWRANIIISGSKEKYTFVLTARISNCQIDKGITESYLRELYEKKTGKHAIWQGKPTKGYILNGRKNSNS